MVFLADVGPRQREWSRVPGVAPESRPVFRFHVQHPARSRVGGQSVVSLGPMIRETARDANSEAMFRGRRLAGGPRLDAHSHPGAGPSTQESRQQPALAEQDESVEEPMFHVQPSRERRPFGRGRHSFAWPRLGPAGTTDRLHDRPMLHWCSGRRGGWPVHRRTRTSSPPGVRSIQETIPAKARTAAASALRTAPLRASSRGLVDKARRAAHGRAARAGR